MLDRERIDKDLQSGRAHPVPLLQRLSRDGEDELARHVAEVGGEYLEGKERFGFASLVRQLAPGVHEARQQASSEHAKRRREEHTSALETAFRDRSADLKERAESKPPLPTPANYQGPPPVGKRFGDS